MNNERRRKLKYVIDDIENVMSQLEEIKDEEQTAHDNLPENLWESDKASVMEDNIQALDDAINALDEVIFALDNDIN